MSLKNVLTLPEYKAVLPSGKEVKYRPFVVKEEKILLMAKESKNPDQIYDCIKTIIKNCVTEPKEFNPDKYAYYDIQQLFILLRCKSMGESVQIRVVDPTTKQSFETELDLEKIELANLQKKQQKIKLNDNVAILFKYPSFSDFLKQDKSKEQGKSEVDAIDNLLSIASICIDKVYTQNETIDCSTVSNQEIVEFINTLPKAEFAKFCEFFKTMPKLTYKSEFLNPTTGKTFPVEVSDFTNFFIL